MGIGHCRQNSYPFWSDDDQPFLSLAHLAWRCGFQPNLKKAQAKFKHKTCLENWFFGMGEQQRTMMYEDMRVASQWGEGGISGDWSYWTDPSIRQARPSLSLSLLSFLLPCFCFSSVGQFLSISLSFSSLSSYSLPHAFIGTPL
jgi:hypothetical protein